MEVYTEANAVAKRRRRRRPRNDRVSVACIRKLGVDGYDPLDRGSRTRYDLRQTLSDFDRVPSAASTKTLHSTYSSSGYSRTAESNPLRFHFDPLKPAQTLHDRTNGMPREKGPFDGTQFNRKRPQCGTYREGLNGMMTKVMSVFITVQVPGTVRLELRRGNRTSARASYSSPTPLDVVQGGHKPAHSSLAGAPRTPQYHELEPTLTTIAYSGLSGLGGEGGEAIPIIESQSSTPARMTGLPAPGTADRLYRSFRLPRLG
ncbi:hypothetical protein BOTBODRAFT_147191 [Botryobasidium botryosum FD-172 SS1]|uniref:Uncharacterized protein n=1 Tax=Botryobasidium botryosum (strain FD-172 SS1) TaxID=930990 RepID=A0A067MHU3_BOTB1|nr:hypothetical protein BOTBODRAFT_147191 [Botryobasidium botryosum FD-172 SS1]